MYVFSRGKETALRRVRPTLQTRSTEFETISQWHKQEKLPQA
jgi:hypothetical protein